MVMRLRREIRSLSDEERERVFAAMDVMKSTAGAPGRDKYGPNFASYDELVAQHIESAAQTGCDEAHLGQAFGTYHRIFTLRFETALLAVDGSIGALPYWDYNIEARQADPRSSDVWKWFGSTQGDPNDGYAVKNGRFGHWRIRSKAHDVSNYTNAYGLLRSPWNLNPSPHFTRYRYACGSETSFDPKLWELCLKSPNYLLWYACIDPTVHTWAHSFLGGIWNTERNVSRVECFLTNAMGIPSSWQNGCYNCTSACDASTPPESCSCTRSEQFRCVTSTYLSKKAPIYGDFADPWSSPNDPIFFFHHANVDRHLMTWQYRHKGQAASHYGFPASSSPCKGHGLNDVLGPSRHFDASLLSQELSGSPITNLHAVSIDGLTAGPYTYDSLQSEVLHDQSFLSSSHHEAGARSFLAVTPDPLVAIASLLLFVFLVLSTRCAISSRAHVHGQSALEKGSTAEADGTVTEPAVEKPTSTSPIQ